MKKIIICLAALLLVGQVKSQDYSNGQVEPFGLTSNNYNYGYHSGELVDIDGDGDLDLFVGGRFGVGFQENTGTALTPNYNSLDTVNVFGLESVIPQDYDTVLQDYDYGYLSFHFEDMDNDGDYDMYTSGIAQPVIYYENEGTDLNPNFIALNSQYVDSLAGGGGNIVLLDVTGDGLKDFVGMGGNILQYNERLSSSPVDFSSINQSIGFLSTNQPNIDSIALLGYFDEHLIKADFDCDGDEDLLVGLTGTDGAFLYVENFMQDSGIAFPATKIYQPLGFDSLFSDVDSTSGDSIYIFNNGDTILYAINIVTRDTLSQIIIPLDPLSNPLRFVRNFEIDPFNLSRVYHHNYPTIGDLDNDGDLDILSFHWDELQVGSQVTYFENNETCGSSSILEEEVLDIKLYPNPSNGVINISIDENVEINRAMLCSIDGILIKEVPSKELTKQIDLRGLNNGQYIFKLATNKGFYKSQITIIN